MKILIVGTGNMAGKHASELQAMPGVTVVGAVDTDATRLKSFADTHSVEHTFSTVESALQWGDFDAVTNATPDEIGRAHV